MARAGPRLATVVRVAAAVARRPRLWPTTVAVALRLAPRRWWRRAPYLPLPDRGYLAFRMETAYGDPDRVPGPHDVVDYLEWCRRLRRSGSYRW